MLKTKPENVRHWMLIGDLRFKQIGGQMRTTDKWIEEIKPDCSKIENLKLNHSFFN